MRGKVLQGKKNLLCRFIILVPHSKECPVQMDILGFLPSFTFGNCFLLVIVVIIVILRSGLKRFRLEIVELERSQKYSSIKWFSVMGFLRNCILIKGGISNLGFSRSWYVYWELRKRGLLSCIRNPIIRLNANVKRF